MHLKSLTSLLLLSSSALVAADLADSINNAVTGAEGVA